MVQGVREKCFILGIFHLPLQVYFPPFPNPACPLASDWIEPMRDPNKELRGQEENRSKAFFLCLLMGCHLRVTDWPCLSSEDHTYLSRFH